MATRFDKCGTADESLYGLALQSATGTYERLGTHFYFEISRNRSVLINRAEPSNLPVYETHLGFKYIGESLDEDKTVPRNKDSAGFPFKSHHSAKDGIVACLLAAAATAPRRSELSLKDYQVKVSEGFGGVS